MKKIYQNKDKRGFTLLEVLISLVISMMLIGAMVVVIYFNFNSYTHNAQTNARTEWLSLYAQALESSIRNYIPTSGSNITIKVDPIDNCLKVSKDNGSSFTPLLPTGVSYDDVVRNIGGAKLSVVFDNIDETMNYTLTLEEKGVKYNQSGSVWLAHHTKKDGNYVAISGSSSVAPVSTPIKNMEIDIGDNGYGGKVLTLKAQP